MSKTDDVENLKVTRNYVILSGKYAIICDAPLRKANGHVGRFQCTDEDVVKVNQMTSVWSGRFPMGTCGGEREKDSMCVMPGPGSKSQPCQPSIMIDDFTYVTNIDIP